MRSHLAKRVISSSSPFHHLPLLSPLLRLSLSTQPQPRPHKELPFMAEYLISSFGFSLDRALKYSSDSHLAAIRSPDRPEAVIKFLKDTGFSDVQIKAVVSFRPPLLACNVEKTLKPKVRELMDGGFYGDLLVQFIRYNPSALYLKDTLSRLLFWRNFVGNNDEALLRIIKRNGLLITYDIDKFVAPRINLLKEYGSLSRDIVSLMENLINPFSYNLDLLRQKLELIEELGISQRSRMFVCGLKAIGGYSKDKMKRNVEFCVVTYGWWR